MIVKEFIESIKEEATFKIYHVGKRNGKTNWIAYCPNKEAVCGKYGYSNHVLVKITLEDFTACDNNSKHCYELYIY